MSLQFSELDAQGFSRCTGLLLRCPGVFQTKRDWVSLFLGGGLGVKVSSQTKEAAVWVSLRFSVFCIVGHLDRKSHSCSSL